VTQQYVNQVLTGRSTPGPKLLDALGLTRITRITRKAAADAG
jgi:hypothetical protein